MRARLVTLAAGLLLVALGIGIGAGPLQDDSEQRERDAARLSSELVDQQARLAALEARDALASAYSGATASRVLAGRLAGRKVALLTVPGTDPATVEDLVRQLGVAGAEVTARVRLTEDLLEPRGQSLVEALSSQLLQETDGAPVATGATGYQRVGALLARATAQAASVATGAPDALAILSGLEAAELVTGEVGARATATVAVLGPVTPAEEVAALTGVLSGYAPQVPTLVAGPVAAAGEGGTLTALRAATSPAYSTVDSVESGTGRIVAVLALAARTRGVTGSFGAVGAADGAVPPGS